MVVLFTLLQSGLSKNSMPNEAPGRETEQTARKMVMMKRVGIISLADFSMPDRTPRVMT